MNELEDIVDEFYGEDDGPYEPEYRVEEQDVRLLKAFVSDDQAARKILNTYDKNLFVGDSKLFADKAVEYFKVYNQLPTKRVLLEGVHGDSFDKIEHVWNEIDKIDYVSSEFNYDFEKVKNRFSKQELINLKSHLDNADLSDGNIEKVLSDAKRNLDKVEKIKKGNNQSYVQRTLKDYMPEFRNDFINKVKNPELGKGVLTGYSYLDYVTNGLSPSDMCIISGDTGSGKSMFLNNMAVQMWMQGNTIQQRDNFSEGYDVLYFSLEMPFNQCARRTIARMSSVSTYALRDCQITDQDQLNRIAHASNFTRKYNKEFEIVDVARGVSIQQIEDRYLESIAKGLNPKVVVIDYLGLMEDPDENGDDWLKLAKIAGKLHEFARMYGVVLLTAVQLNRPKTRDPGDTIGLHRIGRSSGIMHHATLGLQIETRTDEDTYSDFIYHIIKNRNGERGSHTIKKNFQTATLIDLEPYVSQSSVFPSANLMEDMSDKLDKLDW